MVDFALQRKNMVESQVRPSDVTDRRIVRAMLEIAREPFVPAAVRSIAYMDGHLTLPRARAGEPARALLAPRLLARLIQLLELGEADLVLDIAGATGYGAAVVGRLAQTVVALEEDAGLAQAATEALVAAGADNVAVVAGPHTAGLAGEGPFDAILLHGAIEEPGAGLLDQLKDGGRLVAVAREGGVGKATQWRRLGGTFDRRAVFDASAPLVPGFEPRPAFVF
jgi:protein-L-isoaspartate(D-aspartate) O-methyltransferase